MTLGPLQFIQSGLSQCLLQDHGKLAFRNLGQIVRQLLSVLFFPQYLVLDGGGYRRGARLRNPILNGEDILVEDGNVGVAEDSAESENTGEGIEEGPKMPKVNGYRVANHEGRYKRGKAVANRENREVHPENRAHNRSGGSFRFVYNLDYRYECRQ